MLELPPARMPEVFFVQLCVGGTLAGRGRPDVLCRKPQLELTLEQALRANQLLRVSAVP